METACGYLDDKVMWISTDEKKMINRLIKLAASRPDESCIVRRPEENGGCLYMKCPANWLKIKPPVRRSMSDEQRIDLSERMKSMRNSK